MHFRSRSFIVPFLAVILIASVALYRGLSSDTDSLHTIPAVQGENPGGFLSRLSLLPMGKRKRELVSVMIENHDAARPHHAGLEDALLIWEFPVEGFITRFSVLFDANDLPDRIGPVRSLRTYFLDALLPWAPPQIHAGGSPESFDRIAQIGTVFAVNGLGHPDDFFRDEEIPAPHNLFVESASVEKLIADATPKILRWPPYETGAAQSNSGALKIKIDLLNPTNNISYAYDFFTQSYERANGASISRARPKNVLLLEIPVTDIGEFGRLVIPMLGRGSALLFRNGTVERVTWRKNSENQWFTFEAENGEPLVFAQGLTWITVQPTLGRVEWRDAL